MKLAAHLFVWRTMAVYWLFIGLTSIGFPVWVLYINRENGMSEGDRDGFLASLAVAAFGLLLTVAICKLIKISARRPSDAAFYGKQLGIGLAILFGLPPLILAVLEPWLGLFAIPSILALSLPGIFFIGCSATLAEQTEQQDIP